MKLIDKKTFQELLGTAKLGNVNSVMYLRDRYKESILEYSKSRNVKDEYEFTEKVLGNTFKEIDNFDGSELDFINKLSSYMIKELNDTGHTIQPKLSETQEKIIILRVFFGLSLDQTSEAMNQPLNTIKNLEEETKVGITSYLNNSKNQAGSNLEEQFSNTENEIEKSDQTSQGNSNIEEPDQTSQSETNNLDDKSEQKIFYLDDNTNKKSKGNLISSTVTPINVPANNELFIQEYNKETESEDETNPKYSYVIATLSLITILLITALTNPFNFFEKNTKETTNQTIITKQEKKN